MSNNSEPEPTSQPCNEEETWNFHINILGPNSAEVARVFEGLVRSVPGMAFQLSAQQPPHHAPAASNQAGSPQVRKRGRPSKAETLIRQATMRAASTTAAVGYFGSSSLVCVMCSSPTANRMMICGHFGCETCLLPYLSCHGVCPECKHPCNANQVTVARP